MKTIIFAAMLPLGLAACGMTTTTSGSEKAYHCGYWGYCEGGFDTSETSVSHGKWGDGEDGGDNGNATR